MTVVAASVLLLAGCSGSGTGSGDDDGGPRDDPSIAAAARSVAASTSLVLDPRRLDRVLRGDGAPADGAAVITSATARDAPRGAEAALALLVAVGGASPAAAEEPVTDAVVDAAIGWADQLGSEADADSASSGTPGFATTAQTDRGVAAYVARSGEQDAVRLHAAVVMSTQERLARAIRAGDGPVVTAASRRAGVLAGISARADLAASSDKADVATAARREWLGRALAAALVAEGSSRGDLAANADPDRIEVVSRQAPDFEAVYGSLAARDAEAAFGSDAVYRRAYLLVDAALQSGLDLALPAGRGTSTDGAVPQITPVLPAADVDPLAAAVNRRLGLDAGDDDYLSGWRDAFGG